MSMTLLGTTVAIWPAAARAQQSARIRRVGVLIPFENENDPQVRDLWPAFKQRLGELGWIEGRKIQFDLHFTTQNIDRIRTGAAEIAASRPRFDLRLVQSRSDGAETGDTDHPHRLCPSLRSCRQRPGGEPGAPGRQTSPASRTLRPRSAENGSSCLRRSRRASAGWPSSITRRLPPMSPFCTRPKLLRRPWG